MTLEIDKLCENLEEEFKTRNYLVTEKVVQSHRQIIYYSVLIADLDVLGLVDIALYYSLNDSIVEYRVSKYSIPFFINDCESLLKCISFFFGSPFSLKLNKVQGINFERYSIDIMEDCHENPQDFIVNLSLLKDILINIDKYVTYD